MLRRASPPKSLYGLPSDLSSEACLRLYIAILRSKLRQVNLLSLRWLAIRSLLYKLLYIGVGWWAEKDSNLRRREPSDLQSDPFGHSGICPFLLRKNRAIENRKLRFDKYFSIAIYFRFSIFCTNLIAYGIFSNISPAINPISPLSFAAMSPARPWI